MVGDDEFEEHLLRCGYEKNEEDGKYYLDLTQYKFIDQFQDMVEAGIVHNHKAYVIYLFNHFPDVLRLARNVYREHEFVKKLLDKHDQPMTTLQRGIPYKIPDAVWQSIGDFWEFEF